MDGADEFDVDVLVIGTGPAGATAALALATYGIRVRAITRASWLANSPRAHITNQRALEVLRDLGIEGEAHAAGTPWRQMPEMVFTRSLVGEEIARLEVWGAGERRQSEYRAASPCHLLDIPQPLLERVIIDAAAARGALFSFNTEYLSHLQDANGVVTVVRDRLSGTETSVRSRYLVGADGARSRVAEAIDLPVEGTMGRAGTVYARFEANLERLIAHRPGILHRILTPAYGEIGLRTLRAVRPWTDWIAGWGFNTDEDFPDLSHSTALESIREMIGDPTVEVEIKDVRAWRVNEAYATEYSRGRVFCAGDAVHRHPPSSGLGSNTSIQDAFNLAWKLAYVIEDRADPRLLDSYSEERAPVGRQVVERANLSRREYAPLNRLLVASEEFEGQAAIDLLDDTTQLGVHARSSLVEAIRVKNSEFNALGIELNQSYESGAVLRDSKSVVVQPSILNARISTAPGSKIPHAWLIDSSGRKISTLDIVGHGRFTLVTGVAGVAWESAVAELGVEFLDVVRVGTGALRDGYGTWHDIREIEEAGALLVRPDGYIAWREVQSVWDCASAIERLTIVLDSVSIKHSGQLSRSSFRVPEHLA